MFVNVTIPVYNEEGILADNVSKLHRFLTETVRFDYEIVIANNASVDQTPQIAERLAQEIPGVRCLHLEQKGRGRALKAAWLGSAADVLSYMDADLSSDLAAFPGLINSVTQGGFDLAAGSRLLNPQTTTRCWKREIISRAYNLLVRVMFRTGFSDAQCGFKAIRRTRDVNSTQGSVSEAMIQDREPWHGYKNRAFMDGRVERLR